MTYIIDATNKKIGRIATEAATVLLGKDEPDFSPARVASRKVEVVNAVKIAVTPRKLKGKIYVHYTGYPSGLRERSMGKIIAQKGSGEIIRRAVYGMLPANKLRKDRMKNLTVKE